MNSTSAEEISGEAVDAGYITVKLRGFKIYTGSKTFRFPRYKTFYICGDNGTGKSTIYRAIQWAIFPKKNDKVHPFETNNQVLVKVSFGKELVIRRTVLPNSISVTHLGVKYVGDEAESLIARLYSSSKIYKMCISRNSCTHPFIAATAPQRVELLNEMIGNGEEVKKKVNNKLNVAKAASEKSKLSYTKERTRFKAIHQGKVLNEAAILEAEDIVQLQEDIVKLKHQIKQGEFAIKRLNTLKDRKTQLNTIIAKYAAFNDEKLEALILQRKLYKEYTPIQEKVREVVDKLCKLDTDKKYMKISVLTEEELNKVIVTEGVYKQNLQKAKESGVTYNEATIAKRRQKLERYSEYEASIKEYRQYRELEADTAKARKEAVKLLGTESTIPSSAGVELELETTENFLQEALSLASLWEKHQTADRLQQKLDRLKAARESVSDRASPEILSKTVIVERLKVIREILSYEKTLSLRIKYEDKWGATVNSLTETEWFATLKSPEEVRSRISELTKRLEEIKLSESVIKCPHCDKCVILTGVDGLHLIKYEGEIDNRKHSKKQLALEVKSLTALAALSYPSVPKHVLEANLKELDREKAALESILDVMKQLAPYESLQALPFDYKQPDVDKCRLSIKTLKILLTAVSKYETLHLGLLKLVCPTLPEDVSSLEIQNAKVLLTALNKIVVVEAAEHPAATYKAAAERALLVHKLTGDRQSLETRLKELGATPPTKVSEPEVITYTAGLQAKKQARNDILTVKQDIKGVCLTEDEAVWSEDEVKRLASKVLSIAGQIDESTKQASMLANQQKLQKAKDRYKKKKILVNHTEEYKTLFEKSCKACVSNTLLSIQHTTNEFLEMLTDVRIIMTMETSIKIECVKNGHNCGNIKELSDGEASLVSFGLNIAFALQTSADLLILDEVTDKVSGSNKDQCIQILFDVMSKNKKTLLLTDHHYNFGDYDKFMELGVASKKRGKKGDSSSD